MANDTRQKESKDAPLPGSTIDAERQDQSGADHSPARQKDRARDQPKHSDAGPSDDTYD